MYRAAWKQAVDSARAWRLVPCARAHQRRRSNRDGQILACAVDSMCSSCTAEAVMMLLLCAGRSSRSSASQLHQCIMCSWMPRRRSVHPCPVPHGGGHCSGLRASFGFGVVAPSAHWQRALGTMCRGDCPGDMAARHRPPYYMFQAGTPSTERAELAAGCLKTYVHAAPVLRRYGF